ncbi:tetratricopeptide repeat protein [Rhodanobacter aciditrophus]|uniref:tetratricopeptide repeat protein n=1 Tax=Rhodanobacter aciditrophus TaxID=1623218 RepID=UPI003CE9BB39
MNHRRPAIWLPLVALLVAAALYWPGLSGSWLFDDYPNIVDNPGVQPHAASVPALVRAALSSPASEFKRPLASLSFAANYLVGGLDPWGWKLANLLVHLLNGLLVYLLAAGILRALSPGDAAAKDEPKRQTHIVATLIAAAWMLLPINLTAVLYVVQREESMANLFVLMGLIGYTAGRRRMLQQSSADQAWSKRGGFWLCAASLTLPTAVGLLAKETAVMLPLYAFLIEWIVFRFRAPAGTGPWRLYALYAIVLVLPAIAGLAWQLPIVFNPSSWATRDFTLGQRLLSEARIVCDYIAWTLLPTPHALSFYHDQFRVSTGLFRPWTTLAGLLALACLAASVIWLRKRQPLASLGIALFLGCQLLTGTFLPLELVYEHRNYFASFGVLLTVVPWLAAAPLGSVTLPIPQPRWSLLRRTLLACLLLWWGGLTAITAYAWGDPLRLAQELAARAPDSPRAQYELGRTYIVYSHYDLASPYTQLAYAPLERAASFPESSILPQQALIFMNSRMGLPLKAQWWDSMIAKLRARKPGVQDESSLAALTQCARDRACPLPTDRMVQAFEAALDHADPSARLQATYGDYAWNVLGNHALGLRMIEGAVKTAPNEPAYRITQIRMLAAEGRWDEAREALTKLKSLNIGGRLNDTIDDLNRLLSVH